MIYRTKEYKDLRKNIESLLKKIDKQKEAQYVPGAKTKSSEKKLQSNETNLKNLNQELMRV